MSKYLIKVTEQYRCDTEAQAMNLIEEAKKSNQYTLKKHNSQIKEQKKSGAVIDEWRRVTLVKEFCQEKEPDCQLVPVYSEGVDFNEQDRFE